MQLFHRWLCNGIAAASLLLGIVTSVLWVRSYYFAQDVHFNTWHRAEGKYLVDQFAMQCFRGTFVVGFTDQSFGESDETESYNLQDRGLHFWQEPAAEIKEQKRPPTSVWKHFGFAWHDNTVVGDTFFRPIASVWHDRSFEAPLWSLCILYTYPPAISWAMNFLPASSPRSIEPMPCHSCL